MTSPYTAGELQVQLRAGQADRAAHTGRAIGARIPEVAAAFLTAQPMLVLGAADQAGRIWCSLLTGEPGFLHADGPAALDIAARPLPGDPLASVLDEPGTELGMIAIDPAGRRRMRMNGRTTQSATGTGLHATLDQVFANCPKYIQQRDYHTVPGSPEEPVSGVELTTRQQVAISTADTFFIASADRSGHTDASHRGGNPGFVTVPGPDRLRWPDYAGNAMFCTLGNLAVQPAAGLLFIDWETGTTLQLTGTARIDWSEENAAAVPGAERLVEFTITEVVETRTASPLRWDEPGYSRFNPPAVAAA